jgi:hypothetical protein
METTEIYPDPETNIPVTMVDDEVDSFVILVDGSKIGEGKYTKRGCVYESSSAECSLLEVTRSLITRVEVLETIIEQKETQNGEDQ